MKGPASRGPLLFPVALTGRAASVSGWAWQEKGSS
ncbi:hypothetical protein SAMN05880545_0312 [Microbacterium sp. RU33B]|nr:hypothetical protein SAMN05880545_0312 [Microbacterium sp. RU33B]